MYHALRYHESFERLQIVCNGEVIAERTARNHRDANLDEEIELSRGGWLAARVSDETGVRCVAVDDAAAACRDADIIIEATRLERPEVLIPADAVKPGCLVVTYGWMMAVDPDQVSQ